MAVGLADDLEPEIVEYRVKPGDWLLLATDGLSLQARSEIIAVQKQGLRSSEGAQQALAALKKLGYSDNVAASLVVF